VKHNDYRPHVPNYCGENCGCEEMYENGRYPYPYPYATMPYRPRFWQGRRW
jgi:hypothetical protein